MAGTLVVGAAGVSGASIAAEKKSDGAHRDVTSVPCDSAKLIAALVRADAEGGGTLKLAPKCTYKLSTPKGGHHGGDAGHGQPGGESGEPKAPGAPEGPDSGKDGASAGQGTGQSAARGGEQGERPAPAPGPSAGQGKEQQGQSSGQPGPAAGRPGAPTGQQGPSAAQPGQSAAPGSAPGGGPNSGPDSGPDEQVTGQGPEQEVNLPDDKNLLPVIAHPITIKGEGATITRDSNAGDFRFFTVINGGELELVDVILDNGRAELGGALWVEHGGSAVITRTTFKRNTALAVKDGGGGAVFNDGHMTITESEFRDNSAAGVEGQGGGLLNGGVLTVRKTDFVKNSAGGIGGGMANFRGAADVTETAFVDNNAGEGGGLASSSARTKVWDTKVTGNTAKVGGGLSTRDATLDLRHLTVTHNTSTVDGGGISSVQALLVVNNSTVTTNTTRGDGGGIFAEKSNAFVRWTEVSRNKAAGPESKGGGVYAEAGQLSLVKSTIVENSSTKEPGGLFVKNVRLKLDAETVIVKNRPTNCGPTGTGAILSADCQQKQDQQSGWDQ
ncbi:hypothetical protein [Plantactinospora sonchi]|uniref:Right handed beta helix domain-containing protein n=1 Tax=Plantactinospora sonchi TaxID=1544735 RepID=A0ABU7S0X3_9ACTN